MRAAQFPNSMPSARLVNPNKQTALNAFLAHAKRELDAASPHLNPAIALYVKLKPQVGQMTLLDLQFYAVDMEEAARAGAGEAETVKQIVTALDALTPEPMRSAPVGF